MLLVPGRLDAGSAALYVTTCTGFERFAFEEAREALAARSLGCTELGRGTPWAADFGAADVDLHGFRAARGMCHGKSLFVVSGFWRDDGSPEPAALEALASLELVENLVLLLAVQDGQSSKPAQGGDSTALPPRADVGLLDSLSRGGDDACGLVCGREGDWRAALSAVRAWRRVAGEDEVGGGEGGGEGEGEGEGDGGAAPRFRVTASLSGPKSFHAFDRNALARALSVALSSRGGGGRADQSGGGGGSSSSGGSSGSGSSSSGSSSGGSSGGGSGSSGGSSGGGSSGGGSSGSGSQDDSSRSGLGWIPT